ncbi:hypothetical protein [Glycomyces xiaoerkulensis]|nr:hypothetical protein [Glycomyces xiaoerkulensis]
MTDEDGMLRISNAERDEAVERLRRATGSRAGSAVTAEARERGSSERPDG